MEIRPMTDSPTPHAPPGTTAAAPEYRAAVLVPLFAAARHHGAWYRAIDLAQAVALHEAALLSDADAAALLGAIRALHHDPALAAPADAGAFEDLFYLRESRLRAALGPDLAGRLHTGRSRNDIEATIFRLQLRTRLACTMREAAALAARVLAIAEREAGTVILAYTHGQPAQPTTYGHYLAAYAEVLLRDLGRLAHALSDLDLCPLGAAAITTTGFPLDRARLAALLGFRAPQENSYGCIAAADQYAAVYTALRLAFLNIGRLAQDLAFWTGFEVGQAIAPDGFVQISSIMPQKRNPLAIEHLRTMASLGAGHCETVVATLHNTPFADMVDVEGPTQAAGLAAFDMAGRVLPLLSAFLGALRIDTARARANIARSCATMTEVSDSLVRLEGISFRQAHEVCALLSRALLGAGRGMDGLRGEDIAHAFRSVLGRAPRAGLAELAAAATPEHSIAVRGRQGGPAPAALAASLAGYAAALARIGQGLDATAQRWAVSCVALEAAVASRIEGG
jgi:argininosuccinate lyase